MKCQRAREIASDALDGLLAPEDADAFHGHLAHCRACVCFYEGLRESLGLLDDLPEVGVRSDFDELVWARLAEDGRSAVGRRGLVDGWRERVVGWFAGLVPVAGTRRWSFAGATVAVAALFAFSAEPPLVLFTDGGEDGERAHVASVADVGNSVAESPASRFVAPPSPVDREASAGSVRRVEAGALASSFESEEEEVFADMPEAVRAFLRNSRELRLTNQDDRYRRSNYSYPLRRFPDVTPVFVTGEESPGSVVEVRPVADEGTTVIMF